jgi:hypothetical protein
MSKRYTQLTAITDLDDLDLISVVDVSDTTQSAEGSTRKITKANALKTVTDNITSIESDITDIEGDITTLQGNVNGGWISFDQTVTRTGNFTFTVGGDYTTIFRTGTRIRFAQSGTKYGAVISSSHAGGTTTVTMATNTDYTMGANPTSLDISYILNPSGYPHWFTSSDTVTGFSANPTVTARFKVDGTQCTLKWYMSTGTSNANSFTLALPITSASGDGAGWAVCEAINGGTTSYCYAYCNNSDTTIKFRLGGSSSDSTWATSGNKRAQGTLIYKI